MRGPCPGSSARSARNLTRDVARMRPAGQCATPRCLAAACRVHDVAPMDLRRAARTLHEHRSAPWLLGLRLAFLATAGMFLLYLLVANVILRTHLLRGWLGAHPQELLVEYRTAWSLYPGHVEVRDLAIRHQDKNIQLHLGLERAKLHLSLWALTQRTLLVDHLDVQGGTFRLTHKSVSLEGNEGRIRAFPSIEGLTEPFVPHARPGGAHPWTVEIDAITATMREVWTMEYRYRGEADVTGAFRVRPHHEIYVAPSVMVTHGGLLSLGDRELIRGGEGRVEATLDSFDPSVLHGIAIVRQLSGGVQQTGELASLASVADTYFPGANVHLDQGTGPIEITTRLDHGVFQPGGRVTYRSGDAVVQVGSVKVAGDLDTVTRVEGPSEHPVVSVEATMAKGVAFPAGSSAEGHALDLRDVRSSVTFDRADIVAIGETKVTRAATSTKSAHVADLHAWQPIAPEGWTFDGGALTVAAQAKYDGGHLDGRVDARLAGAALGMSTFGIKASGKAASAITSEDVSKDFLFRGLAADLDGIAVRLLRGRTEGLWMRARTRTMRVSTDGSAEAEIAVESGPGARIVELFSRLAHVPDVAADATSGTELRALLHFRARPGELALTVKEAKNGALEGRGRIRKTTAAGATGAFLVSVGPLHAGIEIAPGGVSVMPLADGAWLDERLRQR